MCIISAEYREPIRSQKVYAREKAGGTVGFRVTLKNEGSGECLQMERRDYYMRVGGRVVVTGRVLGSRTQSRRVGLELEVG